MSWWKAILWRLRSWARPGAIDREVGEEMRFHVEMRAREYERAGHSRADARLRALRRFGRIDRYRSSVCQIHGVTERARQRGDPMDKLLQDFRYALRTVARNPGFAATAVLTLSLGIGANVAIFAFTNTMLFKPMPYPRSEELVRISSQAPSRGFDDFDISAPDYLDWREQQTVFTEIAAYDDGAYNLLSGGDPERVNGLAVTASLWKVLDVEPILGRVFTEQEDEPGADRVVVLGHGLWTRRFGSDPALVGEKIVLQGEPYTVIGIMPPLFTFDHLEELWVPLALDPALLNRGSHNVEGIGRLRSGVDLGQAYVEMSGISARLEEAYPETNEGFGVLLEPLREAEIGDERILVYVLSGVVGFVLLIACANVANLMLARASGRQSELAVRAALGAGRGRLVGQLLTESLLLATAGGAIGAILGLVGKNLIVSAMPTGSVPLWLTWEFDARVYAFMFAVTLVTVFLFGFVPALRASRADVGSTLKDEGRAAGNRRKSWMRGSLVVAEVALALVLLIGAGLMMRAYLNVQGMSAGFDPDGLLTARVTLPEADYEDGPARARFFEAMLERVEALPTVEAASVTSLLPVGSFSGAYLGIEGNDSENLADLPIVAYTRVSASYLETMRIPLLQGRGFERRDGAEGTPEVLLVSRDAAHRFWPEESPVGKRVKFGPTNDPDSGWKTVVGVVDDVMQFGLGEDPFPGVYVPYKQSPVASMAIVARTDGDPGAVVAALRQEVWAVDDNLPVYLVQTMQARIDQDDWEEKLFTMVFGAFAVIALALSSVGLYGLVAYSVAQRRREIGIRMALGADRHNVVRMVVRQGMKLVVIGLVIGLVGALGITRVIASLLIGVSPTDPLTYSTIALTLAAVAFAASYLPARRATRVDPVRALREQ